MQIYTYFDPPPPLSCIYAQCLKLLDLDMTYPLPPLWLMSFIKMGAWRVAHGVRRMAQIRSGRGAGRRILFYETENIISGAFRTGARRKCFNEIDP